MSGDRVVHFSIGGVWEEVDRHSDGAMIFSDNSYPFNDVQIVSLETDLPLLYKQDGKGDWNILRIWVDVGGEQAILRSSIQHPHNKTKEYSSIIKVVKSKVYSRVVCEKLLAKWVKKSERDGWTDDKDKIPKGEPMLLHHYDEYSSKLTFPCLIGPKYNGICSIYDVEDNVVLSRKNNPFDVEDIRRECEIVGLPLHGELWSSELTLEEIVSAVKGSGAKDKLKMMVFDVAKAGNYANRFASFLKKIEGLKLQHIEAVPMMLVHGKEEAEQAFNVLKDWEGTDGAVIRTTNQPYKFNTRSYFVLKMKDIIHHEFQLVDMVYDEDVLGKMAKLVFTTGESGTFEYTPAVGKKERVEMYARFTKNPEKYKDSWWTLEFREWTKYLKPRHILSLVRRDYE